MDPKPETQVARPSSLREWIEGARVEVEGPSESPLVEREEEAPSDGEEIAPVEKREDGAAETSTEGLRLVLKRYSAVLSRFINAA